MYCETCPIRDYCEAYHGAKQDNDNSYHPQRVVKVESWNEPPCPLWELVKKEIDNLGEK